MRSPAVSATGREGSRLISSTLISPRYPASTVPGVLTIERPHRAASPERGCTSATYPSGSASAIPVGTSARSPGARCTSTVVQRSAPASPGCAYAGSGTAEDRRRTWTSTLSIGSGGLTGSAYAPPVGESARAPGPLPHAVRRATRGRAVRRGAQGPAAVVGVEHDVPRRGVRGLCRGDAVAGRGRDGRGPRAADDRVVPQLRQRAAGGDRRRLPGGAGADRGPLAGRAPTAGRGGDLAGRRAGRRRPGLAGAPPLPARVGHGAGRRPRRPGPLLAGLDAAAWAARGVARRRGVGRFRRGPSGRVSGARPGDRLREDRPTEERMAGKAQNEAGMGAVVAATAGTENGLGLVWGL